MKLPKHPIILNKFHKDDREGTLRVHRCFRGSPLGNPFTHIPTSFTNGVVRVGTRNEACDQGNKHFHATQRTEAVQHRLQAIAIDMITDTPHALLCYCAPARCHCSHIHNAALYAALKHVGVNGMALEGNGGMITPKDKYRYKDMLKFHICTHIYGAGGTKGSSTKAYMRGEMGGMSYVVLPESIVEQGKLLTKDSIIGVSTGGGSNTAWLNPYIIRAWAAIGCLLVVDTAVHRARPYNMGERITMKRLLENGYEQLTPDGAFDAERVIMRPIPA